MRALPLLIALLTAFPTDAEIFRQRVFPFCEALFGTKLGHTNQLYSGYVRVSSGNELFLRVDSPGWASPKRWFLLVHGMMSNHRTYDKMSHLLLERGIGVIRLDLRGFSRSLVRELQIARANREELVAPPEIHFSEHVSDIIDVIRFLDRKFQIRRPEAVGHSMGGGLIAALMSEPRTYDLLNSHATLIAPYIYRLEYRAAELLAFGNLPVPNPFFALEKLTPTILRSETERFVDRMVSNPQMRLMFGAFFDDLVRTGLAELGDESPESLRSLQIDFGIASVKGMRALNSLQLLKELRDDVQMDMMFGTWDPITDRALAMKFGSVVQSRGGKVIEVNAGHMVPSELPDQVITHLLEPHP